MKKVGLIIFFIISVSTLGGAWGHETGIGFFEQWQINLEDLQIPGIPAIYVGKVGSNWIGAGFLLSTPESFAEDSTMQKFMKNLPLFQFALLLQNAKTNVTFFFNYYGKEEFTENGTWGISAKFRF